MFPVFFTLSLFFDKGSISGLYTHQQITAIFNWQNTEYWSQLEPHAGKKWHWRLVSPVHICRIHSHLLPLWHQRYWNIWYGPSTTVYLQSVWLQVEGMIFPTEKLELVISLFFFFFFNVKIYTSFIYLSPFWGKLFQPFPHFLMKMCCLNSAVTSVQSCSPFVYVSVVHHLYSHAYRLCRIRLRVSILYNASWRHCPLEIVQTVEEKFL